MLFFHLPTYLPVWGMGLLFLLLAGLAGLVWGLLLADTAWPWLRPGCCWLLCWGMAFC
jgi:hypothetical protein